MIEATELRRWAAEQIGGRPAGMLVTEMEGLGPVSAGDERLLERLGWTRPRAVDGLGPDPAGMLFSENALGALAGELRTTRSLRAPLATVRDTLDRLADDLPKRIQREHHSA